MAIYSLLDQLAIPYQRIDHPPVFTCEEASKLLPDLPAANTTTFHAAKLTDKTIKWLLVR